MIDKVIEILEKKAIAIEKEEEDNRYWGGPDPRGSHGNEEALKQARMLRELIKEITPLKNDPDAKSKKDLLSIIWDMEEVLLFYANKEAWSKPPVKTVQGFLSVEYESPSSQIQRDRGAKAREMLERIKDLSDDV